MTSIEMNDPTSAIDADIEEATTGRWRSKRGKFKIFRAPAIKRRRELPADYDTSKIVDGFNYDDLADGQDEGEVRSAIGDMSIALNAGISETMLFAQRPPDGMSLAHVWFGANLPLFRHSHPAFGDCLYYVLKGQAHLGSQVLEAGDGFFVPNGMPYKYTAGPDGVEVLEFRAGGGTEGASGMIMNEPSVEAIRALIETANEHKDNWVDAGPDAVSDSGLLPNSPTSPTRRENSKP
jgi:hypothetical protein